MWSIMKSIVRLHKSNFDYKIESDNKEVVYYDDHSEIA